MPTIYVIAGPNGVGKTTFADRYLPDEALQLEFINADLIARGIAPYQPERAAIEAGRVALGRIRQLVAAHAAFTWETTMSGRTAIHWMREAKAAGFEIKAYFLWVRRVEVTIQRIRQRIVEGGHDIPEATSTRRFFKTLQNFFGVYRPVFDAWKLYENDLPAPRLIAVEKSGRLVARDRKRFDEILTESGSSL